jgi:putative membrane protein
MKTVIRFGLGAALAGALAVGTALAQGNTQGNPGGASSGTGSGAPNSVGAGDTSRTGDSPSTGSGSKSTDTSSGMSGSTGSSDTATGGGGASAGSSSTAAGTASAGKKVDRKTQDDIEKLHAGNQAEIQLAQLASQNASSPDVKAFADQMQTDHQQMDQQLTSQAQTLGVSPEGKTFQKETSSAQKDMKKLQSKTGKDFDKAYMSQMVKDHEKDLKAVKGAVKDAQKNKHTELASTFEDAQTKIQSHLDHAKQVEKSLKSGGGTASSGSSSSSMGTGSANQGGHDPSEKPKGSDSMKSGNRGDTGGPTPGGQDRGTNPSGSSVTPGGGEKGTSSDSGTK